MSNQCYLCCSPFEKLYPSFENPGYEPSLHTIASSVNALPIAWLALFRPEDLREASFVLRGETVTQLAPLAARTACVARLADARPRVEAAFSAKPELEEHFALFAQVFDETDEPWVTLELEEVECLWEAPEVFRAALTAALRYLGGQTNDAKPLLELAELGPDADIPTPAEFRAPDCPYDRSTAYYRLLGAGTSLSPWE